MRFIFCVSIVSLFALNLSQSAKVLLTHKPYQNNSNTQINCTAQLDARSEWFASLEINKDGRVFYNYDNVTKNNPIVTQVPGIDRQAVVTRGFAPGVLVINRLNKTSSGHYTCIVKYNQGQKSVYNATDIVVQLQDNPNIEILPNGGYVPPKTMDIKFSTPKVNLSKPQDINVTCSYKLITNDKFLAISILKEKNEIYNNTGSKDKKYKPFINNKVKGVNIKNNTFTTKVANLEGNLTITLTNVTRDTAGNYTCGVLFNNGTVKNYILVKSAQISAGYQHMLSYILAIFSLFVFVCNK